MKTSHKIILASFLLLAVSTTSVYAEEELSPTAMPSVTGGLVRTLKQEIRNEKKETREEIKEDKRTLNTNIKSRKNLVARIVNGVVTAKTGSTLTVLHGSTTVMVNVTSNTKLRRHFWGSSTLDEISINDKVNVWGKFTDDTKTTVDATLIRDLSIAKRNGVFVGTVQTITGNVLTVLTVNRGVQSVTVDSSTKYINRKEQEMVQADVAVGHRIRVRGMWDKANNTITEVKELKDFTLPVVTRPTENPTPTP